MKRKLNKILKITLSIILLISSSLAFLCKGINKVTLKADTPTIEIHAVGHEEKDTSSNYWFSADVTSGLVTITVTAKNIGSGEITIKYYAEDITAICEAGDYYLKASSIDTSSTIADKMSVTHELTTVSFNSTKTTATIIYDTSKNPIGTKIPNQKVDDENFRYFNFVIADITGGTITGNQKKYGCIIQNNKTANCYKDSNGYYMDAYSGSFEKKYSISAWDNTDGDRNERFNLLFDTDKVKRTDIISNVLDTGLGKLYTKMFIWADAHISNWDYLTFKTYADNSGATDDKDTQIGYWTMKWVYDDDDWCDVTSPNKYDKYAILDPKWGDACRVWGHNDCHTYDRWAKLTYTTVVSDDDYPLVTGSYVDASSMLVDGTIKIILRFSEPIQATTPSNLAVIGEVNSKKDIKFEYVSGNCTDTLCFETTLEDSGLDTYNNYITKVSIVEIENLDTICDFGHNIKTNKNNFIDDYDSDKVIGDYEDASCNIDLRTPLITSVASNNPTESTTSRTVEIKFGSISKATMYYTWSTDVAKKFDSEKDYESSIDLVGDSSDAVKKSVSISNVTGEYYLHVYVVNMYGRTASFVIGSGGVMTSTTGHGYRLDNETPTINNVTLYQESLTSKVYDIRVDDGNNYYNGGIETVYVSIKENKNSTYYSDYPIYSTDATIAKSIATDIEIGDRADVFYMDANLKNVTYTNKSNPSYFGGGSANSLMFSTKEKAKEYFTYNEYKDFATIKLSSANTTEIQTISNNRAKGETHIPAANDVWIRYKKATFVFDGTYEESDWVYYYYSGTNADQINITTALQNQQLKEAVDNVAGKLVDNGSTKNLYTINSYIDSTKNLPSIPYANAKIIEDINKTISGQTITPSINYTDSDMRMATSGGHFTLRLDYDTSIINCPADGYVDLYIGFYTEDGAGNNNRSSIEYKKYRFDVRSLFDCKLITNEQKVMDDIDETMVYNINSQFSFSYEVDENNGVVGDLQVNSIYAYVESEDTVRLLSTTEYSEYFTITSSKSGLYTNTIGMKPLKPGYAKIEVELDYSGTKKKHDPYEFYFTNELKDKTKNYSKSLTNQILINKLYKLSEQYTYMDKDRVIHKESYGNEETGNVYFSSMDALTEYVKYMEYQDLQLVTLTGTMAESLATGGIGTYTKADGDINIPQAGQTWIRYKIATWTNESTENAWVYYWYSNSGDTSIRTNKINGTILETAINTVVNAIVSKATLVNLVNGSYIDENGSPILLDDEIKPNKLQTSSTKTNSLFSSDIQYSGDDKLYDSTVRISIDGVAQDIPILTNLKLIKEDLTHLFYAYYNGQALNTLTYSEITYLANQTYREAIGGSTGTYFIREVSASGICEYVIYLDTLAPTLNIKFTSPTSSVTTQRNLNSESAGYQFGTKTFTISSINSITELDLYSYVIIYDEYFKIHKIFYMKDLASSDYALPNGTWTITVSDRSGNSFTFVVNCTTVKLSLEVSVDDGNDYVKVALNREPDEIYRYQVFLNGGETPIDDTWNGSATTAEKYKESGFYYIYVQDIYGFVIEEKGDAGAGVVFERTVPSVIWSYLDYDNSSYTPYNSASTTMSMYKSLGNVYYISTSRPIKLRMEESYQYEIVGLDVDSEVKIVSGKDLLFGNVEDFRKSNLLKDFEITLWYEDYPDITVKYVITCDTNSPDILLTYTSASWDNTDNSEAADMLDKKDIGYVYTPDKIDYYSSKEVISAIKNNTTINSNLITLNIEDLSGVKSAFVYLTEPGKQEQLLMELIPTYGKIENVSLSRYGYYRVVAYDVFNNYDEITFTNTSDERVVYSVDGEVRNQRDKTVLYGNNNATIKLLADGLLTIEVVDSFSRYLFFINVVDGIAYLQEYRCVKVVDTLGQSYNMVQLANKVEKVLNASSMYVDQDVELFSYLDPVYNTANKLYKVLSKYDPTGNKENPFTLYCSYDQNYLLTFKIECEDDDMSIKMRVNFDYSFEPYLLESQLSKRLSNIKIRDDKNEVIDVTSGKLAYTNATFKVDSTIDADITKIEISYSEVKDFVSYTTIYPYTKKNAQDQNIFEYFDTSRNGFYSIKILNKYGNENSYLINRSDEFMVVFVANYDDGDFDKLPKDYSATIKTNYSFSLEAYSDNVEFKVTKDNALTTTQRGKQVDGYYQLTVLDEGSYQIKAIDLIFGNTVTVNVVIKHSRLVYDVELITGYNEKALSKDEGYTNQKLSISKNKVNELNIKYIEIVHNEQSVVLYNSINDESALDELLLINSIGCQGDGIYNVIFKDEFGSKVIKVIHYSETSPFKIYRKITSSQEYTELVLNDENIEFGYWSNDAFLFKTEATTYNFTVNDISDECPRTIAFEINAGNGTIPYQIYYIDEYGFEFRFQASLDRRTLSIELDKSITTVKIKEILNTSDPISLTYSDGQCYYSIDGGDEILYTSGEKLYTEGSYRFNCFDKSGNSSSLVVIKDSTCTFSFVVSGSSKVVIDGEAFNGSSVSLQSNDNVKITKYYIDGVKQTDMDIEAFRKAGHYHVFLVDGVGNKAVFEFIMISHDLSSFYYQTPNSYIITEMWFSGKDGTFTNYLLTGKIIATEAYSIINNVDEDGDYQVVMTSTVYKRGISFGFTINSACPDVSLSGTDGVTKTIEEVVLNGCEEGDIITVYKDDVLYQTIEFLYNSEPLTITEGGKYRIVVRNEAGNETVLTFEKIKVLSSSGSVLVIIAIIAAVAGIIIGVCLRNKQKFDE